MLLYNIYRVCDLSQRIQLQVVALPTGKCKQVACCHTTTQHDEVANSGGANFTLCRATPELYFIVPPQTKLATRGRHRGAVGGGRTEGQVRELRLNQCNKI